MYNFKDIQKSAVGVEQKFHKPLLDSLGPMPVIFRLRQGIQVWTSHSDTNWISMSEILQMDQQKYGSTPSEIFISQNQDDLVARLVIHHV